MNAFFTSFLFNTALVAGIAGLTGGQALAQQNAPAVRASPLFVSALSNPANAEAKVNAMVSRPGNSQDFVSTGAGTWQHQANSTYTYDNQGRLTMRLYADPITAVPMAREITVYDAYGNEIENRGEQFNGSTWDVIFGYKQLITYNPQNLKTEVIYQLWNSGMGQWENEMREQTVYNASNQALSVTNSDWESATNSWIFMDRMNLSHVNGTATSLVMQEYNGNTWDDVMRAQHITWRLLYETPSAYELQLYDNGLWLNAEKYQATYDANGGHVGVYQEWDLMNNIWAKSSRETETLDVNKNFTGWLDETWDAAANAWVVDGEERQVLTYSGQDITERLFQDSWGSTTATLTDREKEVYSNFQTFNVSGVKPALPELDVNVYPNPASGLVHIALPARKGSLTASLLDVTGKELLHKTFRNEEESVLNIEALPKGIYLLNLQTETGAAVKRLIKQ